MPKLTRKSATGKPAEAFAAFVELGAMRNKAAIAAAAESLWFSKARFGRPNVATPVRAAKIVEREVALGAKRNGTIGP